MGLHQMTAPTESDAGVDQAIAHAWRKVPAAERVAWLANQWSLTPHAALATVARHLHMRSMERRQLDTVVPIFGDVSFAECQRRGCLLGRIDSRPDEARADGGSLVLICHDVLDLTTQQWIEPLIERLAPVAFERVLVTPEDLADILRVIEGGVRAMDGIQDELAPEATPVAGGLLRLSLDEIEAGANPVVRLVDSTLYDALRLGASDIHLEVQGPTLAIRYRLDGVLQNIKKVNSLDVAHQVVSRIKVLADLDIAERRVPQDGRFRVLLERREIDFRVSIMPNSTGEDAVLRVLDRKHLTGHDRALNLDALSFDADTQAFIRHASRLPYGLLLVTGPTGSGKTTTLYAAISEINTGLDKIVTIEDPIEYHLPGVLQIPVNERKGLTFAKGLRSILRHDPDRIMVGEIRDSETAQIAVQAALTGHQVFTTVHANNVFDVIGRFANMGVDTYSLVAALTGIMAQRLVRTLCHACARCGSAGDGDASIRMAVGCAACRGTGYRGRAAIAEILPIDDEMKDLLVQRAPISAVKRLARDRGFQGLRESAVALVQRGMTTADELDRVAPVQP